jgi:hypothetical protein
VNFVKYFQTNSNLNHLTFIFPFLFCLAQNHWDSIVASIGGKEAKSEPGDISDVDSEDGHCEESGKLTKGFTFSKFNFLKFVEHNQNFYLLFSYSSIAGLKRSQVFFKLGIQERNHCQSLDECDSSESVARPIDSYRTFPGFNLFFFHDLFC